MLRLVVIPVRGRDRVEDILPYLDDIAQPGTKVTFLMHLGTRQFRRQLEQLLSFQGGASAGRTGATLAGADDRCESGSGYEGNNRRRLSDVEVEIKFYSGSLRQLLDRSAEDQRRPLVALRPAAESITRWLSRLLPAGYLRQSRHTPVLVSHWRTRR